MSEPATLAQVVRLAAIAVRSTHPNTHAVLLDAARELDVSYDPAELARVRRLLADCQREADAAPALRAVLRQIADETCDHGAGFCARDVARAALGLEREMSSRPSLSPDAPTAHRALRELVDAAGTVEDILGDSTLLDSEDGDALDAMHEALAQAQAVLARDEDPSDRLVREGYTGTLPIDEPTDAQEGGAA